MQKAILCGRPQTTVGGAVQKTLEGKSREQFGVDVDAGFFTDQFDGAICFHPVPSDVVGAQNVVYVNPFDPVWRTLFTDHV